MVFGVWYSPLAGRVGVAGSDFPGGVEEKYLARLIVLCEETHRIFY